MPSYAGRAPGDQTRYGPIRSSYEGPIGAPYVPLRNAGFFWGIGGLGLDCNSASANEVSTIWVGDLPVETTNNDLLTGFTEFGTISSASVNTKPAPSGSRSGFVRFVNRSEAANALAAACMGMVSVLGVLVSCQWAKSDSFGGANSLTSKDASHWNIFTDKASWLPMEPPPAATGMPWGAPLAPLMPQRLPREEELTTLWLGNLPQETLETDIIAAFSPFGQVLVSSVQNKPSPHGSVSGFIRFIAREEAEQALAHASNGSIKVRGVPCVARWARVNSKLGPVATSSSHPSSVPWSSWLTAGRSGRTQTTDDIIRTLFVSRLPSDTTEEELAKTLQLFGLEGKVTLCQLNRSWGKSGFIRFDTPEAAEDAFLLMNESAPSIRGHSIFFEWAKQDTFG